MTITINDLRAADELGNEELATVHGGAGLDVDRSRLWYSNLANEEYDGTQEYYGEFQNVLQNIAVIGGFYDGLFVNEITMNQTAPA